MEVPPTSDSRRHRLSLSATPTFSFGDNNDIDRSSEADNTNNNIDRSSSADNHNNGVTTRAQAHTRRQQAEDRSKRNEECPSTGTSTTNKTVKVGATEAVCGATGQQTIGYVHPWPQFSLANQRSQRPHLAYQGFAASGPCGGARYRPGSPLGNPHPPAAPAPTAPAPTKPAPTRARVRERAEPGVYGVRASELACGPAATARKNPGGGFEGVTEPEDKEEMEKPRPEDEAQSELRLKEEETAAKERKLAAAKKDKAEAPEKPKEEVPPPPPNAAVSSSAIVPGGLKRVLSTGALQNILQPP
eukprot:SM000038S14328  [mRNA]  locus=s38:210055:213845:- [translate_table: standard]